MSLICNILYVEFLKFLLNKQPNSVFDKNK